MARIKQPMLQDTAPSLQEVPPILPESLDVPDAYTPAIDMVQEPVTPPVVMADAKSPLKSKTNWAGAILAIVGALQLAQEMHLIDTLIPDEDTRSKVSAVVLFVGGVLTIILRSFFTYQPTTVTPVDTERK